MITYRQLLKLFFELSFITMIFFPLVAQNSTLPFYPNGTYNPSIQPPESLLGFPIGSQPARYGEVLKYFKYLSENPSRVKFFESGESVERRKLFHITISDDENIKKLVELRSDFVKLSNARTLSQNDANKLIETLPAVVWIGYGIHGDEVSSVDAALQVAYQLAAGTDETTNKILKEVVVCIDPMENPDGRERFLSQMQTWSGAIPNSDAQALQHSGNWPYGRGNHYLFDMNRDMILLIHSESQARARAILSWYPHVLIDSHEMGPFDTYLFSPAREPINPNISAHSRRWLKKFSEDQAKAFDRYGWSYYTREWNDDWYPGYLNSYAHYIDAIGILYEQAGVDGSSVKRPDGTTLTYRETVHHQFTSSIANLTTAANNRKEILKDYYSARRTGLSFTKSDPRSIVIVPRKNQTRVNSLIEKLLLHKIEVGIISGETRVSNLNDIWGGKSLSKNLPSGSFIISLNQPQGRLAKAILETDPRMTTAFLQDERKQLEKNKRSKLYDVTAWSLLLAYNLEAYWTTEELNISTKPVSSLPKSAGSVQNEKPQYGYMFDLTDDRSLISLSMLLSDGYKVRSGKEPVTVEGHSFSRGAILLRKNENPETLLVAVRAAAQKSGITIYGINTALSSTGPDLGGNDFVLLKEPRIAVAAGPEVSTTSMGAIWYLLDYIMKIRLSLLSVSSLGYTDLSKYTTLVLPSGSYNRVLGREGIDKIRNWIENGGTLISVGSASTFIADSSTRISQVKICSQALRETPTYTKALEWETQAQSPTVDSIALWEGKATTKEAPSAEKLPDIKELEQRDQRAHLFMPRGAILRVNLDEDHWINFGVGEKVPAIVYGGSTLWSKDPVQTPARFTKTDELRLSGLLWQEAREHWARTAYATRESRGKGQIILFNGEPNFRGTYYGTERLFLNAILLGPGFGTSHTAPW